MEARLGQHLTLLGFSSLFFCAATFAMGTLPAAAMAPFVVSSLVFLTAGASIRNAALRQEALARSPRRARPARRRP